MELLEKEKAKGAEKVAQIKELLETERFLRVSLLQSKHEKGINSLTFPGDEIGSLIDTGKLAAEDVLVSRVGDQRREMERVSVFICASVIVVCLRYAFNSWHELTSLGHTNSMPTGPYKLRKAREHRVSQPRETLQGTGGDSFPR